MTDLERELFRALSDLQSDYVQRLNGWETASKELESMFERTSKETADLRKQVENLTGLVLSLSKQLKK